MKLPYTEGSVFVVPLRDGGYARGVVARATKRGKVLFGYFFGPKFPSLRAVTTHDIDPSRAILCIRFGDLGLIKGVWPIVGNVISWDRSKWPMIAFIRREEISKRAWLVHYSDNDPTIIDSEIPTDFDANLPRDSMAGYGAVEIRMTKLLKGPD
jgi:hypothetical protein